MGRGQIQAEDVVHRRALGAPRDPALLPREDPRSRRAPRGVSVPRSRCCPHEARWSDAHASARGACQSVRISSRPSVETRLDALSLLQSFDCTESGATQWIGACMAPRPWSPNEIVLRGADRAYGIPRSRKWSLRRQHRPEVESTDYLRSSRRCAAPIAAHTSHPRGGFTSFRDAPADAARSCL